MLILRHALRLKLSSERSVEELADISSKLYSEAGFSDEQRFVFQFKAAQAYKNILNSVSQRASYSFEKLQAALVLFHLSCSSFRKSNDTSTYASNQDMTTEHLHSSSRNTTEVNQFSDTSTTAKLDTQLSELLLIVKKQKKDSESSSRDVHIRDVVYRFREKNESTTRNMEIIGMLAGRKRDKSATFIVTSRVMTFFAGFERAMAKIDTRRPAKAS